MRWNYGLFWLAAIWGAAVGVLALIAFIQERGIRRVAVVGGWFGLACLCVVAVAALALFSVGVL